MTTKRILGCFFALGALTALTAAQRGAPIGPKAATLTTESATQPPVNSSDARVRTIKPPFMANADNAEKELHQSVRTRATQPTASPRAGASVESGKRREANLRSIVPDPAWGHAATSRKPNEAPHTRSVLCVDATGGCSGGCYTTIQAAIDAAGPGDTINVYPGNYDETATGRFVLAPSGQGPHQFGLFIDHFHNGLIIQGVDCSGTPIADAGLVVAHITTNATNNFGYSGTFIEADNLTITGLDFGPNIPGTEKTIELIGDNAKFQYCQFSDNDLTYFYGGSFYMDDWRVNDSGSPAVFTDDMSHVQSYDIEDCQFKLGVTIDIASGAGFSGSLTGRKILNNTFDGNADIYSSVSFNGYGTCVPWFVYGVGGAMITGNSFSNGTLQYIKARGGYDNSQFDWETYWNSNTFDKSTITLITVSPFVPRDYSYAACYSNVRRIGATIQDEIDTIASAGDTVLVGAGNYIENVVVGKSVEIYGSGQGITTVRPAISNANCSPGSLCGGAASNVFLVQADDVTIHDLTVDGENPALGAGIHARNGIITNHSAGVYDNLNVHDATVKNIYLRGIYASSGGSFDFEDNTVDNVQSDPASIGMFNFGGSGVMAYNNVSNCNDALSSNWSTGTQYHHNTVTSSGSGVHTDNNGGFGGIADSIYSNDVSNGMPFAYGVWAFAPYVNPTISDNTVTNMYVGLAAAGSQTLGATVTFERNVVDGQSLAGSFAGYITTSLFGFGDADVKAVLNNNVLKNTVYGVYVEETAVTNFANSKLFDNSFSGNSTSNLYNGGTTTSDASGNWWNTNVDGSITSTLVGSVDHTPWLASGTDTSGANGFQGDFSSLYVGTSGAQVGATGRIQEGVNLASSGGTVHVLGGSYSGNVSTGANNVTISPGASPAQVTINGNLALDSNDTLAVELNGGAPGSGYDQLVVNGTVNLGGASISLSRSFSPSNGQVFRIIDNDLADAVSGIFNGYPEGSLIYASGIPFKISYVGGTGNDVILTTEEAATLQINYDKSCYQPGSTLSATVRMSGLTTPAAGFQAFLQYDTSRLTFTGWTYTCDPFAQWVLNTAGLVNPSAGLVNVASGIDQTGLAPCLGGSGPQSPSQADADLVTLTFTVAGPDTCPDTIGGLLTFRPHNPPTRLTDINGQELAALTTINGPAVSIDGTAPDLFPPANSGAECDGLGNTAALAAWEASATATDTCSGSLPTTFVLDSNVPGCCHTYVVTGHWTATDNCGNTGTSAQRTFTVVDTTLPSITCPEPVSVSCPGEVSNHANDYAGFVGQGGSASDTCCDSVMVAWISDVISDQTCPNRYTITRTYRATDGCNNSRDCTQMITVDDETPPVFSHYPNNRTGECDGAGNTVALNAWKNGAAATDTCPGAVIVEFVEDEGSPVINCCHTFVVSGHWKATDVCGNYDVTPTRTFTIVDTTAPSITCPNPVTVECASNVPAHATDYDSFVTQGGLANDTCCDTVMVTWISDVDITPEGHCPNQYVLHRTYRATDGCGNHADCVQTITIHDDMHPILTAHPASVASCYASADGPTGAKQAAINATTAHDNCTADGNLQYAAVILESPNGDGDYCTATVRVTVTDECGNSDHVDYTTRVDHTPPMVTCPDSIMLTHVDAGTCSREVTWNAATAFDTCAGDVSASILYYIDGSLVGQAGTTYTFGPGHHTVTAKANDGPVCSNEGTCTFSVDIDDAAQVVAAVELSPAIDPTAGCGPYPATVTRCITFEVWDNSCTPPTIVGVPVTFTVNRPGGPACNTYGPYDPVLGIATFLVANCVGHTYDCVTARDKLHTLRSKSTTSISLGNYVADFTGKRTDEPVGIPFTPGPGQRLVGGNLNDDIYIDILDFGTWAGLFNHNYGTGNTTCSTTAPHADISGDGLVTAGDFGFIAINFLMIDQNNCCSGGPEAQPLNILGTTGPVRSISVADLRRLGLARMAAGDVNHDGVLDEQDIAAVYMGQLPNPFITPGGPGSK